MHHKSNKSKTHPQKRQYKRKKGGKGAKETVESVVARYADFAKVIYFHTLFSRSFVGIDRLFTATFPCFVFPSKLLKRSACAWWVRKLNWIVIRYTLSDVVCSGLWQCFHTGIETVSLVRNPSIQRPKNSTIYLFDHWPIPARDARLKLVQLVS